MRRSIPAVPAAVARGSRRVGLFELAAATAVSVARMANSSQTAAAGASDDASLHWYRAAAAFSRRLRDTTQPLPTAAEYVTATKNILDRHTSSAVMAAASGSGINIEAFVPLNIVVALAQSAADMRRHSYLASAVTEASSSSSVATSSSPATSADATATADSINPSGVRNYDRLFSVFDSGMRHIMLACQRQARTSTYYVSRGVTVDDRGTANANVSQADVTGQSDMTIWEAAVSVMASAHFSGVLQHEYDGPGEDIRINGTSRIWRNFGHVMASEAVGDRAGRAAWLNALTLVAFMTPLPEGDAPPCCGFTRHDDEIAMSRAVEDALARADKRYELLNWHQLVRARDPVVSGHVCRSASVRQYARALIEQQRGESGAAAAMIGRRESWGVEQDVCGDVCIANVLRTVAPNAWKKNASHGEAAAAAAVATGMVPSMRTAPFIEREWHRSPREIEAIDQALSRAATAAPPGQL